MRVIGRCGLMVGLALLAEGTAAATPAIVGDANDTRCLEALHLANAAFQSNSPTLLWPIAQPSRTTTRIILRQNYEDITGGHAIEADPVEFKQFIHDGQSVTTHWGTHVHADKTLAVVARHGSWKGDIYSVYLLGVETTPEQLELRLSAEKRGGETGWEPVLGERRWNPPIVLLGTPDSYWIIDRGEPYEVMADWHVQVITANGLASPCRISFGYSDREGLAAMPSVVRRLAAALDETLGPGENEGTLQPTARIRLTVEKEWANAALRPWALTAAPYNTRSEVVHGLAEWATGNRQRTALLKRIKATYPAAELALTSYYGPRSTDGANSSGDLGRQVLDHMFRSYFVFPKSP
jgi:hypothetical protein